MRGYDPACEELAELFIDDPPERSRLLQVGYTEDELIALRRRLAQTIQDAIEGWFSTLEDELERREPRVEVVIYVSLAERLPYASRLIEDYGGAPGEMGVVTDKGPNKGKSWLSATFPGRVSAGMAIQRLGEEGFSASRPWTEPEEPT